jgi:hypothetical protein
MNLRELVAALECQKPEASEFQVMMMDETWQPLLVKDIGVDAEVNTVWLLAARDF